MDCLRVGVIGLGNMGYAHLSCIVAGKIEGMCLTAACDISESKRERAEKTVEGSFALYEDYHQMLADQCTDAVIVAVPHRLHSVIAMDVLNAGQHVLVEKPEDVSVTEAKKLNSVAKESGKIFAIMFNQRTNPLFQKAREIVQSGELGDLKRSVWVITNWYRTQSYYDSGEWRATWSGEGGGVLLNQAPHNLDLWQWICGMPVAITANCATLWHNIEVEDDVTIFAEYENGATGTFITSTGEYPGTNRLEISGSLGKLVLEDRKLRYWRLEQSEREYCFSAERMSGSIPVEFTEIEQKEKETAHAGILQNFANAILKGEQLISPGYEGINELSISNAAYLSAWTGKKVTLPFDSEAFDRELATRAAASDKKVSFSGEAKEGTGQYSDRWQVRW